jgi:hypothetical protein
MMGMTVRQVDDGTWLVVDETGDEPTGIHRIAVILDGKPNPVIINGKPTSQEGPEG